uniref:Uncharacterized protein n=1 Tax=Cacopsylla melanoneura TaxID=428564 RepID=A0A8D8XX33_9HEMI
MVDGTLEMIWWRCHLSWLELWRREMSWEVEPIVYRAWDWHHPPSGPPTRTCPLTIFWQDHLRRRSSFFTIRLGSKTSNPSNSCSWTTSFNPARHILRYPCYLQ